MTFEETVKQFMEQTARVAEKAATNVVVAVGDALIDRTPVGEPSLWKTPRQAQHAIEHGYVGGHMKANWQTQVGAPINEEITDNGKPYAGPADVSGALAKSDLRENAGTGDRTVFITNNVPYAESIEDGSSTQAQTGIVAPVVDDFDSIAAKAIAEVAK